MPPFLNEIERSGWMKGKSNPFEKQGIVITRDCGLNGGQKQ
jgi:hypothetical protein